MGLTYIVKFGSDYTSNMDCSLVWHV